MKLGSDESGGLTVVAADLRAQGSGVDQEAGGRDVLGGGGSTANQIATAREMSQENLLRMISVTPADLERVRTISCVRAVRAARMSPSAEWHRQPVLGSWLGLKLKKVWNTFHMRMA